MKPLIALFTGGYSSEKEISIKSAGHVRGLISDQFEVIAIVVKETEWFHMDSNDPVSFQLPSGTISCGTVNRRPDFALIMIHGTPGENGLLQGALELASIPYNTGNPLNMGATFDKGMTVAFLEKFGFPIAKSQVISASRPFRLKISYPLFCKPCEAGSSFGISLVESEIQLKEAIQKAAKEGDKILLEEKMTGREISCGVYENPAGEIIAMRGTEIKTHHPFFNYEAKYLGESEEITPADLSPEEYNQMATLAKDVYQSMDCKGLVRIDFIYSDRAGFRIIEINTVPGFTSESIVPQQIADLNIRPAEVFGFEFIKKA